GRGGGGARPQASSCAGRSAQGVRAFTALLSATPCSAAASGTANWKYSVVPLGTAGQCAIGSVAAPLGSVAIGSVSANGTGSSTPPLNAVGVLDSETNSTAAAEALAELSDSVSWLPGCSVPVPTSFGAPEGPARLEPRLVHTNSGTSRAWFTKLLPFRSASVNAKTKTLLGPATSGTKSLSLPT